MNFGWLEPVIASSQDTGVYRVILHLDMDAFFASVEQRDRPELKGLPVIVGSPSNQRGVVCAASYEARRFGIRSAMPSRIAGRLCPEGVFLRPRMERYREESEAIMRLVSEAGPVIQKVSVDEAYMDFTAECGSGAVDADDALLRALPLARTLQQRIRDSRGLTSSIGIASNKLLAKMGSDFRKPAGLTLIPERDKVQFLRGFPVRALHGVGEVTEKALQSTGLKTVGDVQDHTGDLRALVGSWGPTLRRFAFGEDDRPLEPGDEVRSISSENTFGQDTDDRTILRACLKEQAADISERMTRRRMSAQTVQVKVRYGDFSTLTRQISVEEAVDQARDIYRLGCWLLAQHRLVDRPLRLIGLGVSGLRDGSERQMSFRW